VNTFSEMGFDVSNEIDDFGDVTPLLSSFDSTYEAVEPIISKIMKKGMKPLVLGGDHSISFPVLKALKLHLTEPFVIVHFDAHPDIYENFMDNPSSHASPFARILENNMCKKLISVGVRTATEHQRQQIKKYDVTLVEAKDFPAKGCDLRGPLLRHISASTPVYISFDMDVLEPGLAPGVSHREAGGLTVRQAIDAIHCIPGVCVGADLVEFNPLRDLDGVTASVAAKLMKELAAKLLLAN